MDFPNWVIYTFTAAGIALLVLNIIDENLIGIISDCFIIAVGIIAIWNKKNPTKSI